MGPFDKAKDSRKPQAPGESDDNIPLLPVRRKSRRQNVWNDDSEQDTELGSLRRRSNETLRQFSEGENEEDIRRLSVEEGGYRNSEDNGLAKTSIDDPHSVGPRPKPVNSTKLLLRPGSSESLFLNQSPTSDFDPDELKLLDDDSPYEEVRAAVSNTDDSTMACETIRVWVIGSLFAITGSGLNILFSMRAPSIGVSTLIAQLVAYPVGNLWGKYMPNRTFTTFGREWTLNPGPLTIKEHTLITIMANVSFSVAYATDVIIVLEVFYRQHFGYMFQILLTLTTQMLGYGIAGICRRWLVYPSSMIWPDLLGTTTLLNTLHNRRNAIADGWTISRYRFFLYVLAGSWLWYFIPGLIFPALSTFAFVTWMFPRNVAVNQVFGMTTGMALLPITFDWSQITGFLGSPLTTPWFAAGNIVIGLVLWIWIVCPILHFGNVWEGLYFPFSSSGSYDNTQHQYDVSKVLTPQATLDEAAYKAYSPIYMSTTFAFGYALSFGSLTAVLVHTVLFYNRELFDKFRTVSHSKDDIHARLYRKYPEVPDWWYLSLFGLMMVLSIVVCEAWDTRLPWWGFLVTQLIPFAFTLPIGMVQAITNVGIGLNVITEFVAGYMFPGRPIANMMIKAYGYMTMSQGLGFVADLKLGLYMKVPPRAMFRTQIWSTVLSAFVNIGVMNWVLRNVRDVCAPDQQDHFSCPGATVFFNASIIWGVIGPQRIFAFGMMYADCLWFFLLGALLPIPIFLWVRMHPKHWLRYIHIPLIMGGLGMIPPATPMNYISWAIVNFIFNFLIKRRWLGWWTKYNYVLSAGLDIGLAIGTTLIFFVFTFPDIEFPSWWGTEVIRGTADVLGTPLKTVEPGQILGPSSW